MGVDKSQSDDDGLKFIRATEKKSSKFSIKLMI